MGFVMIFITAVVASIILERQERLHNAVMMRYRTASRVPSEEKIRGNNGRYFSDV